MKRLKNIATFIVPALVMILLVSFSAQSIPKVLQEKIDKAVKETYAIENFMMVGIRVSEDLQAKTKTDLGPEHLFRLENEGATLGYLYLGQARSKENIFDYIVLFQPDFTIKKSKILIYREDYGRQIGSQRWLKQFIGLSPKDKVVYGQHVDAISGATISASSMTNAVNELLEAIRLLQENKVL